MGTGRVERVSVEGEAAYLTAAFHSGKAVDGGGRAAAGEERNLRTLRRVRLEAGEGRDQQAALLGGDVEDAVADGAVTGAVRHGDADPSGGPAIHADDVGQHHPAGAAGMGRIGEIHPEDAVVGVGDESLCSGEADGPEIVGFDLQQRKIEPGEMVRQAVFIEAENIQPVAVSGKFRLGTALRIESGRGAAEIAVNRHAVAESAEFRGGELLRIAAVAHVDDGEAPDPPVADVELSVGISGGLRLRGADQRKMAGAGRIGHIDDFDAVDPLGDEDGVLRNGNAGGELHRVEPGDDPRPGGISQIEDPEAEFTGGEVEPAMRRSKLAAVAESTASPAEFRVVRSGDVVDAEPVAACGVEITSGAGQRNAAGRTGNDGERNFRILFHCRNAVSG